MLLYCYVLMFCVLIPSRLFWRDLYLIFIMARVTRARAGAHEGMVDLGQIQDENDRGPEHQKRKYVKAVGPVS